MREAIVTQLLLTQRILDCEENGWNDLLVKIDNITQNVIDAPSAGFQIKAALILWCDSVDIRLNSLPPDELVIMQSNPQMATDELFGATL
jgi:hypothetical protein